VYLLWLALSLYNIILNRILKLFDPIMALLLRDQPSWEQFFSDAKIPKKDATTCAKIFVSN